MKTFLLMISVMLSLIHYFELQGWLVIILGAPSIYIYGVTALLLAWKVSFGISKFWINAVDLYYRFIRLTNPSQVVKVVKPAPTQIGKPRKFSTSSVARSPRGFRNRSPLYNRILDTVKPVGAMLKVKLGRPLVSHLLRMVTLTGLGISKGLVKVIISFCAFCFKHIQKSGITGLIIYLKACYVILQQASGKHRLNDMSPLKVRFARNKAGLPRVIPALHRARIRRGEWLIIKLWATLFSIYRVLEMPYKFNLKTITSPSTMDPGSLVPFSEFLYGGFWPSMEKLRGFDDTKIGQNLDEPFGILKSLRATPFTINKSSSAAGYIKTGLRPEEVKTPLSTSPAGILAAVACWFEEPHYKESTLDPWCKATGNQWVLNRLDEWRKVLIPRTHPSLPSSTLQKGMYTLLDRTFARGLGRLGFKEEAAGKLRVFAFVDPFTQWLLRPLHDALFEVLDLIPQDGTTDQLRPVHNLLSRSKKGTPFFSFDLSAATDRLPLVLQMSLLSKVLTSYGATLWAQLLVGREYKYSTKVGNRNYSGSVIYAAGQPMGALSSWAMLAFTHHVIVQFSAFNAKVIEPGDWFEDYALLGDDIVIANAKVADEYRKLMQTYGVEIGLAKSLVSRDGLTLEFAKRTFHKGNDISPVPFSEYWVARQMLAAALEMVNKYNLSLAQYLTLWGFGFKAKASAQGSLMKLGQRLRHRILSYYSPLGPRPMSLAKYFSLRGLQSSYTWTEGKINRFIDLFVKNELSRILTILDDTPMQSTLSFCKQITTVNRDREYYGTVKRSEPNARKIDLFGLHPDEGQFQFDVNGNKVLVPVLDKDHYYFVVDQICNTVYREVYFDCIISIRDLRNKIEDYIARPSGNSIDFLEQVVNDYYALQDQLTEVPLPKEIYVRVATETRLPNLELIKQWETYSRVLRSTISTESKQDAIKIVSEGKTSPAQGT